MLKVTDNERILITGISGFLGTALARKLAEKGYQLVGLSRRRPVLLNDLAGIQWIEGSILDTGLLKTALRDVRYVFHLAAYARPWASDYSIYEQINVQGTKLLLEESQKAGVSRLVYTSTAGVISPSGSGMISDEYTERTIPYTTAYESSKAKAEELVRDYPGGDMEVVVVNPSRVFGIGAPSVSNGVTRMISLYLKGLFRTLPGDGRSIGNYVHIEDVVEGHLLALEKGQSGKRYILGGENVSYREFFRQLAEVSGNKRLLFPMPLPLMIFVSRCMLLLSRLTGRPPLITPPWIRKYNYNWSISSDLAKKELGYSPMSLEEGLRKTVLGILN